MRPFEYQVADDPGTAVATVSGRAEAVYLAGGTNLVDHMKLGVASPELLVDVSALPLNEIAEYDGGVRIGATVANSDLAAHPLVRQRYPVLSHALLAGASGQLRNSATTGGNLLQRTRCPYFQDATTPCNKREPGSGCSAREGSTRDHAILGASRHCVATHPSDMAVALTALDASAVVLGEHGERRIPVRELHRLPGDMPQHDTVLDHGELITAVELPDVGYATRSTYRKVRDRASFAFALVSVAAAVDLDGGTIRHARIAFGGLAHKPWRAVGAEDALAGQRATDANFRAAADVELAEAQLLPDNEYKVLMARNTMAAVLRELAEAR